MVCNSDEVVADSSMPRNVNETKVILNNQEENEESIDLKDAKDIDYIYDKIVGGGSIRDWDNPFGESAIQEKFMLCYGNPDMSKVRDKNGRMFWYDSKWDKKGE